jgi:spermidine synthase
VYEVAWQRYLTRLLGSESLATAVILAVFLGGLSLGYRLFGHLSARVRSPFRVYALLEAVVGAWCLAFPGLFHLVDRATEGFSFAPPWGLLGEGTASAVVLMGVPTLCMGGTMPLLTRGLSLSLESSTRVHARIYAVNTAGAVVGSLLAGFWLLHRFGLPATLQGTAFVNLTAAAVFLFLARQKDVAVPAGEGPKEQSPEATESGLPVFSPRLLNTVAFLSGTYVMTLETVLIRYTSLTIGSSTYAFSVVVAVFVLSIAVGGFAVSKMSRFPKTRLWSNQMGVCLLLLLLFTTLDKWPYVGHLVRIACQSNLVGFWLYQALVFAALTACLVFPVGLMGATLPLAFHERKRDLQRVGQDSGALFSWNALGSLTGGLGGGLLLHYVANNGGVFLFAAGLSAVAAGLAARPLSTLHRGTALAALALVGTFAVAKPSYDERHFAAGTFRQTLALAYSLAGPGPFYEAFDALRRVVFYKDGPSDTVAVTEDERLEAGEQEGARQRPLAIFVNGKSDSNTFGDRETLRLSAHIPALWSRRRSNVMIIGLGTGCTAGEFALYPDVQRIDVAEISPTVIEALPLFRHWNRNVAEDPRLHIEQGDALRVLRRTRRTWDIVVSEPSNPWVTGTDQLFSREFYHLVRSRLSRDGFLLQWVQAYSIDREGFGIIINSLKTEFENVYLFRGTTGDILVLANDRKLAREDRLRAEASWQEFDEVRASLEPIGMNSLSDLFSRELLPLLRKIDTFERFGIETLDHPRLHYLAGRTAFTGDSLDDAR